MDNINKKINSWHKEISRAISSTGKKKSISGKTKSTCGDNRLNMCFDELELFDLFYMWQIIIGAHKDTTTCNLQLATHQFISGAIMGNCWLLSSENFEEE
jgi:hypothetical protein